MPRNQFGDVHAKQLAQPTMLSEQPLRHVSDGLPRTPVFGKTVRRRWRSRRAPPWMEQVDTQLIVLRFTADDVVAMPADLGSTCGAVVNDVQV
jgi:hypothetical protein